MLFKQILSFSMAVTSALLFIPESVAQSKPKLVLQITVDQLRGDLPFKYQDRFGDNGFNYLLKQGAVYRDAHHSHANTETIVGHVTLATGAYPSTHGLIANSWYDRDLKRIVYNIEDPGYSLLSKKADVDKDTEIDPTQKAAKNDGRSPLAIKSSTISDEVLLSSNGKAKVFGVSIKDRGAVSMAGHGGKAFWFSKATGEFVTSDYYYKSYPKWVVNWNDQKKVNQYRNTQWQLSQKAGGYLYKDNDDNAYEMDLAGYGRTFPHNLGDSKYFTTLVTANPVGDELTADFAKQLIVNEGIGKDSITDYLSVSFSATDYVGHFFGTASLEMEDNMLRLDKTLADFLGFVDKKVGLDNTLIVLSADHGSPDIPPYLDELHLQGHYVEPVAWDELPYIKHLKQTIGFKGKLIEAFNAPYIYINNDAVQEQGLNADDVQAMVAKTLSQHPSIKQAIDSNDIIRGQLAKDRVSKLVSHNYYPGRSGDIYLVFHPQSFINKLEGLTVASMHGSPWRYDTFVPVIFAGQGIKAQHIFKPIETVDIAPTIAAYLQIKAPSATNGRVLKEVVSK